MTNSEFIDKLALELKIPVTETEKLLKVILDILCEEISDSSEITIEGFGSFTTIKQNEYISENVKTGERYLIPPKVVINFESDGIENLFFEAEDSLVKSMNNAFEHFKPTLLNEGIEFAGVEIIKFGEREVVDDEEFAVELESVIDYEPEPVSEIVPDKLEDFELSAPQITEPPVPDNRKKRKSKTSKIWVPIAGGVAIAVAALFFFNGRTNK